MLNLAAYEDDFIRFSGGEIGLGPKLIADIKKFGETDEVIIKHNLVSSDRIMELLLATEALQAWSDARILLAIAYLPYARQDRRMIEGDVLSIKVMANLINAQNYYTVSVLDPHSDVGPALINNCWPEYPDEQITKAIRYFDYNGTTQTGTEVIIIPDAGATKRVYGCLERIGDFIPKLPVVQAHKIRDLNDKGNIKGITVDDFPLQGKKCLIIDDICDGGKTFIELGKILKERGASSVGLYVTHGIFSKGIDVVTEVIDTIYTTNSFKSVSHPKVVQFGSF